MVDLNNKSNKLIVVYLETGTQQIEVIILFEYIWNIHKICVLGIKEILANLKDSLSCRTYSLSIVQLN